MKGGKEKMSVFDSQLTIKEVINLISKRVCLVCQESLDSNLKKNDWHIPLCKKHRVKYLEEVK